MILKSKDIRKPTAEEVAEMNVWGDGTYYIFAKNSSDALIYVNREVKYLIYMTSSGEVELQYYYYFSEFTHTDGTKVPKDCWVYYSVNNEYTDYKVQKGAIYFNERGATLYSNYIAEIGKAVNENQIYLGSQKGIVLKTADKYCKEDIEVAPLLQKKVVTTNGIVTPDEGFSGLDGVLIEVPYGVIPSGTKELKKNKTTYYVRDFENAYVNIAPEDLDLAELEVIANGEYTPKDEHNGFSKVTVNVSGDNLPTLQEKELTYNGKAYPDSGYDGFSSVRVNVQPPLETKTITKNGTYTAASPYYGFARVNVEVSEPISGNGKYLLRYVSFDGRVLSQHYMNTGDTFDIGTVEDDTTYKMNYYNGQDDFLIKSGVSRPVAMDDYGVVTVDRDITISTLYRTQSQASYFDITLNKNTGLTVTLKKPTTPAYGGYTIYWGDGTVSEDIYSNSRSHTYSAYGDYTIKIKGLASIPAYFFGSEESASAQYCTRAFLSQWVTAIDDYAFSGCKALKTITLSPDLVSIGAYAFNECASLKTIAIPSTVTSIGAYAFNNCTSLFAVALPNGITDLSSEGIFSNCRALNSISLPDSLTGGIKAFFYCSSLTKIFIPSGINKIYTHAFLGNESIMEYDFSKHTKVPTMESYEAFTGINALCKIIVPDNLYNKWITTGSYSSKWSKYENYIYKASEV